jgi:hypothetical protein
VDLPTFGRPTAAANPLLIPPPGWGLLPAALDGERTHDPRTRV